MEPQTPAAQKNRRAHDKSPDYGLDGDITSSPWDWTTPFYAQLGESELATMLQWPTPGSCTRRETRPAVDGPTAKEHKETTETPISTVTFDVTQETSSPLGREDRVQTTRGSPIPESTRTRSSARVCRCQAETHVDALFQSTEQRGDDASNNAFGKLLRTIGIKLTKDRALNN